MRQLTFNFLKKNTLGVGISEKNRLRPFKNALKALFLGVLSISYYGCTNSRQ